MSEGTQTEPLYVERLVAYLRSREASTHVEPVGVGRDPRRVVEAAIRLRVEAEKRDRGYDQVVVLVDVDTHATLSAAIRDAQVAGIDLLVTNLKFEVWLRWHAEDKRGPLSTGQLDNTCASLGLVKAKKLTATFPIERVDEASRIAYLADPALASHRIGPDPSSAMPLLVEMIRGN